jgi:hypothetical protein
MDPQGTAPKILQRADNGGAGWLTMQSPAKTVTAANFA